MRTQSTAHKTPVLAIVLVSYLMIVLDISIVITALPKIHSDLHFSATGLSWAQNAYTLAFGGLLLLGARAGTSWAAGACSSPASPCSRSRRCSPGSRSPKR
jgi:MFS family permease